MIRKIHIVLPTYNPEEFFNKFFKHLDAFNDIKKYISFGIIFQTKYSQEDIMTVVDEFLRRDLLLYYDFKEYNGTMQRTPLIKIRDDAAMLNPDAEYFLNVDDDIIYTCSSTYLREVLFSSINFMEKNNIGSIMLGFPSHNDPFKEIRNDGKFHKLYGDAWCGQGLLLKNVYDGHIVPIDATMCLGGNDDVLMADCRTYLNKLPCYYYGVAVGHHTDIKEDKDRSMNRLNFKQCQYMEGSCRRYIQLLRGLGSAAPSNITNTAPTATLSLTNLDTNNEVTERIKILNKPISLAEYLSNEAWLKDKLIAISLKDAPAVPIARLNVAWLNLPASGSYLLILDRSNGFKYERLSKNKTLSYSYKKHGKELSLVSSDYVKNNFSAILLNNKNYSANGQGLNFAIFNANTLSVVDVFRVDPYTDKDLKLIRK